ncbi:MAG: PEP-utilizing enzyme, partial [Acidobacteriota bacterium]
EDALSGWLSEYGHRGPLESDPARPRFRELSDLLRVRLASSDPRQQRAQPASLPSPIVRPLFWFDARREWFRSELMKRWERLRARILEEGARLAAAGAIDRPEDVFLLTGGGEASPRRAIEERRRSLDAARALSLPAAASRDAVAALVARAADARDGESGATSFRGIALSAAVIEGTALKADDLVTLISSGPIEPGTILVVPALEPSWALVFPQVAGVVAEVGGELSHASILLREASKPAVVNCAGIFRGVRTGDRLRLDGAAGRVEIVARAEAG